MKIKRNNNRTELVVRLSFLAKSLLYALIAVLFFACEKKEQEIINGINNDNSNHSEYVQDKLDKVKTPFILEGEQILTMGNPAHVHVQHGNMSFGVERFSLRGLATGHRFIPHGNLPVDDGFIVYGYTRSQDSSQKPQVWRSFTKDGINYSDQRLLYELPESVPAGQWKGGSIALSNGTLLLFQNQLGSPALKGHPFHPFSGTIEGANWKKLTESYVYKGQDSYHLVWNNDLGKFVNYQISYQPFSKKYPDNIPKVRRVLHIRTSADGITWSPGESFGADGPYLPNEQLIVPDNIDYPDTEFYKFLVIDLDELWAGIMVKYVSEPSVLPNRDPWPHGPFLDYEWWISQDGFNWERPFRESSDLDGLPHGFIYNLSQPIKLNDKLMWTSNIGQVFEQNRKRLFYTYSRSNAEIVTPIIQLSGNPISVEVSFESILRNEDNALSQGYLMAELLDESGKVISGFEREKCRFMPNESTRLTLKWGSNSVPDLGQYKNVQLRLSIRDIKVYSVSY